MRVGRLLYSAIAIAPLLGGARATADVSLPAIFGDHMVLQRDAPVPVWGRAQPGEAVTVAFGAQSIATEADAGGRWRVALDPLPAGAQGTLVVTGANRIAFDDVAVGDVWICSGQSNMEWPVSRAADAEREIAEGRHPRIRLFTVPRAHADTPQREGAGAWAACTPETVRSFSAVAYFFGRELEAELDVPIGLVNTSWGGTPAEAWTSMNALRAEPRLTRLLERWAEPENPNSPHRPACLFNAMISPLVPFAMRGAIWYQGESNAGRAHEYRTLFPIMIRDWRRQWGEGDFPFIFVQLANYRERAAEPGDSAWAELREAQLLTLRAVSNTGMAVIIDIGDAKDIHPRNKQDVGRRLAQWALAHQYGRSVAGSGPLYRSARVDGDRIVIEFDHADVLTVVPPGPLTGFAIAGADRRFVPADAVIAGATVIVSAPSVPEPVAARYAWANNPAANLYNAAGLPASPFRTDHWPGITAQRPREQWVRKTVIGGNDQVLAAALHEDLWIAFDPGACAMREAWTGVGGGAAGSPQRHRYHRQPRPSGWSFACGGHTGAANTAYGEHETAGGSLVFRYALKRPRHPDVSVRVEERPAYDSTVDGDVCLVRRFSIDGLPEGCAIALDLSGESAGETWLVEGVGTLEPAPDDAKRLRFVQRENGASVVRVTWPRPAASGPRRASNSLTAAEKANGWRLLFDGATTDGWRRFGGGEIDGGWRAEDGALTRVGPGGDIVTVEPFGDFELALEWRISPGGNSGVFYRVQDGVTHSGPEMQVLDNAAGTNPAHTAGACYDMYAPARDVTRRVGTWNTARIIARGPHVEHWINGVRVVSYDIDSPEWRRRYDASKYCDNPAYAAQPRGHLMLQDHGNRVGYRSIRIRRLDAPGEARRDAPWRLAELNYAEVKERRFEVAVLPLGCTEPHNLHLPYGTDTLEGEHLGDCICGAAHEAGAKVVLLPTIPYGTVSNQRACPLSINVAPSTLFGVVADIVESLAGHGVLKVLLLNSHGGNDLKPLLREQYGRTASRLFLCNWYAAVADVYREIFEHPEDHAGEMETSIALAYFPELVARREDGALLADDGATAATRFRAVNEGWVSITRPWHLLTTNTGAGNPHAASAEKGRRVVQVLVDRLAPFLLELSEAPLDERFPF